MPIGRATCPGSTPSSAPDDLDLAGDLAARHESTPGAPARCTGAPHVSTLGAMSKTRTEVLEESQEEGHRGRGRDDRAPSPPASLLASPVIGAVAAVPGVYFAWKWWKHRTENGIRF